MGIGGITPAMKWSRSSTAEPYQNGELPSQNGPDMSILLEQGH